MDPLELAKVFVKTVVRMFYDTEHIVVIDALVFHGALSIGDLVLVLDAGKNTKGAQKLCGRLKEGGLISVYSRAEVREGAMKAMNREYYYIDYRRAVDTVKYKIYAINKTFKHKSKISEEKKEFSCPQCKAQWTVMDLLDCVDPLGRGSGFFCKTCGAPTVSIDPDGDVPVESSDAPAKFNQQFKPLLDLMKQIDDVIVPAIEGKDAVESAIELPRDKDLNPAARHEAVPATTVRPTTVKGIATAPEKIEVSIATKSEYTEAARAQEAQRQAKIAQQNLLPTWHTKSTVTDKEYASGQSISKPLPNGIDPMAVKAQPVEDKKGEDLELDAVFAQLEEQRRKEAETDPAEDDEDSDEFEDAMPDSSTVATPNGTGIPEAKRVKLDTSAMASPINGATPMGTSTGDGGDESDEDEFEDV